jgi:sorting nexin-8
VDALRKKVETRSKKVESLRSAKKAGWEIEVEKLNSGESLCLRHVNANAESATDVDNSSISSFLSRRVFIKACMWHELAVVFHSRQAVQATLGWRAWAAEELESSRGVAQIWEGLAERLERMPVE